MSAAPSHLKLLQTAFNSANFLARSKMSLEHRRDVAGCCIFFKILNNLDHPLQSRLPAPADPARRTRRAARMNTHARNSAISRASTQFNRTFFPHFIEIWNFLPQNIVDAPNMPCFKRNVNKYPGPAQGLGELGARPGPRVRGGPAPLTRGPLRPGGGPL